VPDPRHCVDRNDDQIARVKLPEQIDNHGPLFPRGRIEKLAKKMAKRARRRAEKRDPENAPKRDQFKGWTT
jgi:hypothetical protein